jgi:predicted dehydrogenase
VRRIRIAVVGAGIFGRHHLRVLAQSPRAELVAAVDIDRGRAESAAKEFGCEALVDWRALAGRVDAAVVAVPTTAHAEVGCGLLEAGIDVLVEKPIAADLASADRLIERARARGRILQAGHLESFNPAVAAVREILRLPLFFEIHRLSVFTPRSLDVDVVLDLMIHDIDIVLSLTRQMPEEIRAAGISILSGKVDIASARLAFPNGCIANLTASRVSTERVRKLRLFQPHEYVSLDYGRQDVTVIRVTPEKGIAFDRLEVKRDEPLRLELEAFLDCVEKRQAPLVGGEEARRALEVALGVLARIEEHAEIVRRSLSTLG